MIIVIIIIKKVILIDGIVTIAGYDSYFENRFDLILKVSFFLLFFLIHC